MVKCRRRRLVPEVQQENRDTLLTADRYTTLMLEPVGDGKVRVKTRTTSWENEVLTLGDQALLALAFDNRCG